MDKGGNSSKVALEGMQFYAFHGYYDEEQLIGTYFVVDVYVETNFINAAEFDELDGTVNYETVYTICRLEMKKTARLIENVANRILGKLTEQFPGASNITVRLSKMNPPLGGPVARSFVEISSNRMSEDIDFDMDGFDFGSLGL